MAAVMSNTPTTAVPCVPRKCESRPAITSAAIRPCRDAGPANGTNALVSAAIEMNPALILIGILGFVAGFAVSLGPVMWVLFSELFPNRLRGMAISFVGLINSGVSFLVQLLFPWELENLGNAMTFLIFGLFAVVGDQLVTAAVLDLHTQADHSVRLRATGRAHVIIDVSGWISTSSHTEARGARLVPVGPARLLDTRTSGGPLRARQSRALTVRGATSFDPRIVGIVPNRSSVSAVEAPRNVATSISAPALRTWARRKRRPISRQLRNTSLTCSGLASVATSKSFGSRPSKRSRTPPPTRCASKPADFSRYSTLSAFGEILAREIEC